MPSDTVRLIVSGREVGGFSGATISMAIDEVADEFSLTLPFDPSSPIFRPFALEDVQLYIDDDLLLTGYAEKPVPGISESGRSVTINGRSRVGQLVDCSIDGPLEYEGLSFATIAQSVCKPFGIVPRIDSPVTAGKVIDLARAEYGQKAADFLNTLAAPRLLLLNSSYDGRLVVSWGPALKDAPVVAELAEGSAPVLSVSGDYDGSKRYSVYKVAAQTEGDAGAVGIARDSSVRLHRPLLVVSSDLEQDPTIAAQRLRAETIAKAYTVSAGLAGWRRPDGRRWAERQALTLKAPGAMLYKAARFVIAGLTLELADGGRSSSLRLVPPELYAGEIPKETPWA